MRYTFTQFLLLLTISAYSQNIETGTNPWNQTSFGSSLNIDSVIFTVRYPLDIIMTGDSLSSKTVDSVRLNKIVFATVAIKVSDVAVLDSLDIILSQITPGKSQKRSQKSLLKRNFKHLENNGKHFLFGNNFTYTIKDDWFIYEFPIPHSSLHTQTTEIWIRGIDKNGKISKIKSKKLKS